MRSATRIVLAAAAAGACAFPAAAAASPYSDAVLASGPLSYLEMDETSGSVALDSSAHGRHAKYVDAGLGAGSAFSGSTYGVSLGSSAAVESVVDSRSGSVEMWVKPASNRRQQAFASHGNPAGDGWSVGLGARRKVVFVSGGKVVDSKLSLPSARWTMLTVTWDAERVRFYANGGATIKQKRMEIGVPASSRADVTVGSTGSGAFSAAFQGGIDEVALFPTPLTPEAIKGHFVATSLPINTAPPTITGSLVEGSALTVNPGTYELETGSSRQYEWQRCDGLGDNCEDLSAVGSSYELTSADVGATLQVAETAQNAIGGTTVISEPTGVVQAAPSNDSGTGLTDSGTGNTDSGAVTPGPAQETTGPVQSITETGTGSAATTVSGDVAATTATGTTTGAAPAAAGASCARIVYSVRAPHTLRKRMAGVGRVSFSARAKSAVRVSSPLRVVVAAKRGKLRNVTFRLDGRKVSIDRKAPYSTTIKPSRLAPGKHVLRARIVARNGRVKTLTLGFTARGC